MKFLFSIVMIFCVSGLFAAPLERGYSQSPAEARQKVIDAAKKYENTPYVYGGLTRSGLDCSGFIYVSFRDALGVTLPRSASGIYSWAEKITLQGAQPGDLLFFKTDNSGNITHVGLYLGSGRFIHSASAGEKTGVIYSNLSEPYWARAFAGAGRALPEVAAGETASVDAGRQNGADNRPAGTAARPDAAGSSDKKWGLLFGVGIAPTWNFILQNEDFVRGFASQFRFGADTYFFGPRVVIGLELRPEYDGALGVFRLPVTLSLGINDKLNIFAGPVISIGDASIASADGERSYSGGTKWCGAAGVTLAPLIINTAAGEFAPYFETAWQYYFNEDSERNFNADISAISRFSTGVRWTMRIGNR